MRKFESEEELRRYALAKGAAIKRDDGTFNEAREKVAAPVRAPREEVAPPPPPPAPPPAPVVVESDLTVRALVQQTATLSQLFDELREEIRQASANHALPPDGWEFDVERGRDGLIQKITAKAYRPKSH